MAAGSAAPSVFRWRLSVHSLRTSHSSRFHLWTSPQSLHWEVRCSSDLTTESTNLSALVLVFSTFLSLIIRDLPWWSHSSSCDSGSIFFLLSLGLLSCSSCLSSTSSMSPSLLDFPFSLQTCCYLPALLYIQIYADIVIRYIEDTSFLVSSVCYSFPTF